MDGEVEQPARVGQVSLGPEQRHRPIAGERLGPGRDDERQQRDPVTLRRRAGDEGIAGAQVSAPEQLDRDHRLSLAG